MSRLEMSEPQRVIAQWNSKRLLDEAFQLLREGRLSAEGLVHPIVPFSEAAEAYREIDESPEKSIKLGISHEV